MLPVEIGKLPAGTRFALASDLRTATPHGTLPIGTTGTIHQHASDRDYTRVMVELEGYGGLAFPPDVLVVIVPPAKTTSD